MQSFIWIGSYDLWMYIPFHIRSLCREKPIDVVRTQDTMCGMMMIEFVFTLNPIRFLISLSDNRADFLC